MARFYYEIRRLGRWWPRAAPEKPTTKTIDGRLHEVGASGSVGPEIRAIEEVNAGHEHLDLESLRNVYGDDGKFRSCRSAAHA